MESRSTPQTILYRIQNKCRKLHNFSEIIVRTFIVQIKSKTLLQNVYYSFPYIQHSQTTTYTAPLTIYFMAGTIYFMAGTIYFMAGTIYLHQLTIAQRKLNQIFIVIVFFLLP